MKNVVAYCRVSTDGQVGEDKFGIDSQKQQIIEYAAKSDLVITRWYVDEGISGAKERRPQFDLLLSGEIENPPVEAVIVAKADRIARDINLYYAYKNELNKKCIELISASEDWTAQDKLTAMIIENFLAMAATLERENIRRRTMGGRNLKAKGGSYSGGKAPYGYRISNGQLVIDEDEAKVVREIYSLRAEGVTLLGIIESLSESGFKSRSGKDIAYATVHGILNNENTYRGLYKYGPNGTWVRGQHEPILI